MLLMQCDRGRGRKEALSAGQRVTSDLVWSSFGIQASQGSESNGKNKGVMVSGPGVGISGEWKRNQLQEETKVKY